MVVIVAIDSTKDPTTFARSVMDAGTPDGEMQRSRGRQIPHGKQSRNAGPRAARDYLVIYRLATLLNRLCIGIGGKLIIGFRAGRAKQAAPDLKHVEVRLT